MDLVICIGRDCRYLKRECVGRFEGRRSGI